jgi:putative transposase
MSMPTGIRLRGAAPPEGERFNYLGTHRYIVTLPVHGSEPVFSAADRTVVVLQSLRESCWHHHFDVYAYCFLPDRLLLLVRGKAESSNLKDFLREFRTSSNELLKGPLGRPVWGRKYLERVLRKTELSPDAARRIYALPVKLNLASSALEYPLQGSFVERMSFFYAPPPEKKRMRPPLRPGRPGRPKIRTTRR